MGRGTGWDPDPRGLAVSAPPLGAGAVPDRFSSGMCSAIMVSGSWHCTAQPSRSPARRVSTCRKWLGMRLHDTGISICISSRGGHCGVGFLRSLINMAADSGMMFWGHRGTHMSGFPTLSLLPLCFQEALPDFSPHFSRSASLTSHTSVLSLPPLVPHHCTLTFCFPSSNWMTFWCVGRTKTAGNSFVLGSTWEGRRGQGEEEDELEVVLTLDPQLGSQLPQPDAAGVYRSKLRHWRLHKSPEVAHGLHHL